MRTWLDVFFSNRRWYRRWRGGYWARWYIDSPVCCLCWFNDLAPGQRPGLGRGTPTVEDYR
jgi:hypothetical protein